LDSALASGPFAGRRDVREDIKLARLLYFHIQRGRCIVAPLTGDVIVIRLVAPRHTAIPYHRDGVRERKLARLLIAPADRLLVFFRGSDLLNGMTPLLVLALIVAFAFTGCGKRPETASPAPASSTEPAPTAAGAPAAEQTPASVPRSDMPAADLAATLGNLTQALRKYSFEHQRLPKTFSEVVAAGYVKDMPQAPAGQKFAIDAKTVQVILVKQ